MATDVYTLYRELFKAYNNGGLTDYSDVIAKAKNILALYPNAPQLFSDASLITTFARLDVFEIPLAFWTLGIYRDNVPGSPGVTLGALASQVGTNSLTPSPTAPKLYANALDGQNGAFYPSSAPPYQYFACDPIAAFLRSSTADWIVAGETRLDKTGEQPFWSAARSDGNANDKLTFRLIAEAMVLIKYVGGVAVSTFTGPRLPDPYSTLRWAVVSRGGQITFYFVSSGQTTVTTATFGSLAGADLPATVDRLSFGATVSSVPYELMSCYQNKFAAAPAAPIESQAQWLLTTSWGGQSYLGTQVQGLGAISPGDSIMLAAQDVITGAGLRDFASAVWQQEAEAYWTYGGVQAGASNNGYGVGRSGSVRNTFTSCTSGLDIASISGQALLDIANSPAPVAYWLCYMGGGDNNVLVAPATICSRFVAAFTTVMNAMIAKTGAKAHADISPIIPLQDPTIQANLVAVHALWAASVVAPLQAAFPGRVYACDMCLALGGVWSATYFGADTAHPNRAGHAQMALHPTYGRLNAKNELGETLMSRWRRDSPTAPKLPTLSGSISFPAAAASLPSGTPVTVLFDCSRIGSTPVFRVDGVSKGTATAIDIYDATLFSGSYVKVPHNTFQFIWTPGAPDIGARALTVTYTDVDGVTTATSATVNVTVT